MQDRKDENEVNPGIVEQRLDDAHVRRESADENGGTEGEGLRGGPITERERPDGGQITQREAFSGPGQEGREGLLHGTRSGGSENTTGGSDPMPPAGGSSR